MNNFKGNRSLLIIQPVMKSYRVPFFVGLHEALEKEGVTLRVAYGEPWAEEMGRGDNTDLPSDFGFRLKSQMIFGRLLWIPAGNLISESSYVVVEHANKNLINYPLLLANKIGIKRAAFWGHGRDLQRHENSIGERFKRLSVNWPDWWFAYTSRAAQYVRSCGFDASRVTAVGNAIDTRTLVEQIRSISNEERNLVLEELRLPKEGVRLIYCGSLYSNKRLDILFGAADAVHKVFPNVQLLIIGGGELAPEVVRFSASRSWVRYLGPQFSREKAKYLALSSVWLNPGVVGLGVLDAFSAGVPVVTCSVSGHGPEVEYLESGVNSIVSDATVDAYAATLIDLISSPAELARLQRGASSSSKKYSMQAMVDNFSQGVVKWMSV